MVTRGAPAAPRRSSGRARRGEANTPLRRIGGPEEVAAAIAFLASDDAAYVSGDVLHVTGGRY